MTTFQCVLSCLYSLNTNIKMYYFMNFAGLTLNDDKMKQISCPRAEVMFHVTCKTAETAALMGGCVIGPIQCLQEGKYDYETMRQRAYKCGVQGLIAGAIMGPVLSHMRLRTQPAVSIYDRAYRLRYNFNQVRTDRFTMLGSLVGTGAAFYMGEELKQGAFFGMCGGCVLAGVLNYLMGTAMTLQSAI